MIHEVIIFFIGVMIGVVIAIIALALVGNNRTD